MTILYKAPEKEQGRDPYSDSSNKLNYGQLPLKKKLPLAPPKSNIKYRNQTLYDVTHHFINLNRTIVKATKVLFLCDKPKIRAQCESHTSMRVHRCEFDYENSSRSYCWSMSHSKSYLYQNKCYTTNEYEYDENDRNNYIRICKFDLKNSISSLKGLKGMSYDEKRNNLMILIPAWLSFLTTLLSVFFMLLTLVTFFLVNKLRNIPGWNIINLTIALLIAQCSFLIGPYLSNLPVMCFIIALTTHYGYLASIFWSNAIAFDLFRNFSKKGRHILLQSVNVRHRISQYCLYAWLVPFFIVSVALIIDLTVDETFLEAPFRPCYSSYLHGCDFMDVVSDQNRKRNDYEYDKHEDGVKKETLMKCPTPKANNLMMDLFVMKTCWIKNGRAVLVFFGLPIMIIIVINAVFYINSIFSIQKLKKENSKNLNELRRYSKMKLPTDEQVRFFIQMAVILGFQWITGFLMTYFSSDDVENLFDYIFIYMFILSNASIGVFIFFSFIFKREVKHLILKKLSRNNKVVLSDLSNYTVSFKYESK